MYHIKKKCVDDKNLRIYRLLMYKLIIREGKYRRRTCVGGDEAQSIRKCTRWVSKKQQMRLFIYYGSLLTIGVKCFYTNLFIRICPNTGEGEFIQDMIYNINLFKVF